MQNIYVYSYKERALCHAFPVIYGSLNLLSYNLFQRLQQIEPELGCMSR